LVDDQVEFLCSLSSILKMQLLLGKNSVKHMKEFYKNYLHHVMLDGQPWKAFKEMCEAYKKWWIDYAKSSKKDQ
jgi:hypothetical protein